MRTYKFMKPALLDKDLPLESAAAAVATDQWGNSLLEYNNAWFDGNQDLLFFKQSSLILLVVSSSSVDEIMV